MGGTAAILMEVLHPSVMAGVSTQSSFRTEPLRRARNTLGYVLRTTFSATRPATGVPWAVMRAFETYNRSLSIAEKDRYLTEQAVIGRMGGADWVPETVAQLVVEGTQADRRADAYLTESGRVPCGSGRASCGRRDISDANGSK